MTKNLSKLAKEKKIKYFLISFIDSVGTNLDLKTPNKSTKLIKKYFIFFCFAIFDKSFAIKKVI